MHACADQNHVYADRSRSAHTIACMHGYSVIVCMELHGLHVPVQNNNRSNSCMHASYNTSSVISDYDKL